MKQRQQRPFIDHLDGHSSAASPMGTPLVEQIELDTLRVHSGPGIEGGDNVEVSKHPLSPASSMPITEDDSTAVEDAFQEHFVKIDYDGNTKFSLKKLWRFVGPGLLVSQALLDPGNIESDISQADTSGYQLLWLLLVAHIVCIFVQSLAARLGVITGRHLAQHIRLQYPRPFATALWVLSELAIIGADIQEVIGTAIALHILTSMPIWAGVVITAVDSFLFLYIQRLGVRATELVFGLLVSTLAVCFWIEMVLIKPDAKELIRGMVIPRIPQGSVVQAVGIVGCVLMPHNLYLHSALVGSRKLDRRPEAREGAIREAMRYFRIETSISLIYAYLINMAVVVVFCKAFDVLRAAGTPYVASLADGATVLSSVLGHGSKYVYAVGLLAIGQSTTMSGTLSGQYVTEGFWNMAVKPWQRVLITRGISLVPALTVALAATAHMDLLSEIINVLQAVVLSFTIIPLLKLQATVEVVGPEFVFGRVARGAAAGLTLAIVALNAYLVVSVISLDSAGMYVAMVAVLLVYIAVLSYTALFPLRCTWRQRAWVDLAPVYIRVLFGRSAVGYTPAPAAAADNAGEPGQDAQVPYYR
ncbi:hypothetical protein H4R26_002635 [Coemansia thaxteri]|uniref:Natural resistance-associated macrophage protein n=1 Tax=Coemansia thaxteri TaxID=2663907 RepID=A0A9W8EJC0_9FUNG|nr:hypothetical protein H4R26_002635 [Coemansia thaxteri]KAJ2485852.1 hypothetical protein EV174_001467 [Coemansia sp. RSA 2320]